MIFRPLTSIIPRKEYLKTVVSFTKTHYGFTKTRSGFREYLRYFGEYFMDFQNPDLLIFKVKKGSLRMEFIIKFAHYIFFLQLCPLK